MLCKDATLTFQGRCLLTLDSMRVKTWACLKDLSEANFQGLRFWTRGDVEIDEVVGSERRAEGRPI